MNTLCAVLASVKQDEAVLNRMKEKNRSSGLLQEALAISAINTPFFTATAVPTAAAVSITAAVPIAAAIYTATAVPTTAAVPITTNNSTLPTIQDEVPFPLLASNASSLVLSQVFFSPGNVLAPSNNNVAIVLSRSKSPRLPESIKAFPNAESLFSVLVSSMVDLLGEGRDLDKDVTFLMNQYK